MTRTVDRHDLIVLRSATGPLRSVERERASGGGGDGGRRRGTGGAGFRAGAGVRARYPVHRAGPRGRPAGIGPGPVGSGACRGATGAGRGRAPGPGRASGCSTGRTGRRPPARRRPGGSRRRDGCGPPCPRGGRRRTGVIDLKSPLPGGHRRLLRVGASHVTLRRRRSRDAPRAARAPLPPRRRPHHCPYGGPSRRVASCRGRAGRRAPHYAEGGRRAARRSARGGRPTSGGPP